jgi:hypothetical protein
MNSDINDVSESPDPRIDMFGIDTGDIFHRLQEQWEKFDRAFLAGPVENAILTALCRHQIFLSLPEDVEERRAEIYKAEKRHELEAGRIKGGNGFPFVEYFFANSEGKRQIVDYSAPCQLSKDDGEFMLFFALKLSLIDVLQVNDFLEFHLTNSFLNDVDQYGQFLKAVELKYREHIPDKFRTLLVEYITRSSTQRVELPAESEKRGVSEFTLARQVLVMHYMFKHLGITRHENDLTDMAKLVQGLTGRQTKAADIRNTEIYKLISNPFSKGDKALSKDLRFVRDIFDKLNHKAIVEEINREILDRE